MSHNFNARGLLLGAALLLLAGRALAEDIHVAVAANFAGAMRAVVAEFEQTSGDRVKLSFGSSGKFYAQIQNGAPFEVFFSADQAKPRALEQAGLVVPGSRFTYALGALVLWSSRPDFLDKHATRLMSGEFNRLALANPRLAPYGVAAVEVLDSLELTEATRARWVQGENVAQTFQFVSTGNVDLAFIALSQVVGNRRIGGGSSWVVPPELYRPIRQDAVLLQRGENSPAARHFLRFVRSPAATAIIESYGYGTTSAT